MTPEKNAWPHCAHCYSVSTRPEFLRGGLNLWRQASLPAVAGGILPPGKNVGQVKHSNEPAVCFAAARFAGLEAPATSAKLADATIVRPDLTENILPPVP